MKVMSTIQKTQGKESKQRINTKKKCFRLDLLPHRHSNLKVEPQNKSNCNLESDLSAEDLYGSEASVKHEEPRFA